jgi:hypothetical protein
MKRILIVSLIVMFAGLTIVRSSQPVAHGFVPAIYRPGVRGGASGTAGGEILAFREGLPNLSIRVPENLGPVAFSQDGVAIYGVTPGQRPLTIAEFQLRTRTYKRFDGVAGFDKVRDLLVEPDQAVLISGLYRVGSRFSCGIFEVQLSSGVVRQLLEAGTCRIASIFTSVTTAPNELAVGLFEQKFWALDFRSGVRKLLIDAYTAAAYSPDGKWIAIVERGRWHDRLALIDPANQSLRRDLGEYNEQGDVTWSPDSRELLIWEHCSGGYVGTLVRLDVSTGRRTEVPSSKCAVRGEKMGWISSDIT